MGRSAPAPLLLSVNLFGRLELRLRDLELLAAVLDGAEETRLIPLVAGRAGLFHLDQQRVAIAIKSNVAHDLRVTAALAFHPEFLPRPAPKMGLARRNGRFQRSPVH